jgi:hypothetical protein
MYQDRFVLKGLIIISLFLLSASSIAEVSEYLCGVQTKTKEFIELEGFSILRESQNEKIELPSSVSEIATVVMCWRSSLIPVKGDYKVILMGYPFYIVEQNDNPEASRMVALEFSGGSYQVRQIKGELNEAEVASITNLKLKLVR